MAKVYVFLADGFEDVEALIPVDVLRRGGQDVVTAAINAAHLRLRPILMTSFAFILGCLPLAIATGPGAGSRVSMGNAVVGGMTFNTFVGIFLIPVLFVVVERFFSRGKHKEETTET